MSSLPDRYLLLIHKYFRDELTEIEQKEFDQALEDPEFRSEVDLQAQVFEGLIESRREKLHASLQQVKSEIANSNDAPADKITKPKISPIRWLTGIAAIVLLASSLYLFLKEDTPNNDAIYAEYYNPYDTPESQRGNNEVKNSALDNALSLYEDEKYSEALSAIKLIRPTSENLQLLEANCHLNLGQWESAESILQALTRSQDSRIVQYAEWYLALFYIKSNKSDLANKILNRIKSNPEHLYQKKVIKMLEDYEV